jgi:Sulfotransferase domain
VYIPQTFSVHMFNILTIFTALITALEVLGIHSCHMKEVAPLTHAAEMWNDGLRAKYYGQGKPYGKKEFDKLLGNFGVRPHSPECLLIYKT